jgi:hypothetical protein
MPQVSSASGPGPSDHTQLPGGRIQGALENAKLKVIFGTGRQTAEAIARELYMPDPKAIKHEVVDETVKDRTHPVFAGLGDQFEVFTQSVQQLRRRRALVKLPDKSSVAHVRIPEVPASCLTAGQLERLKQGLAKDVGTPYQVLKEQIARRAAQHGGPFHLPQARPPAMITWMPPQASRCPGLAGQRHQRRDRLQGPWARRCYDDAHDLWQPGRPASQPGCP